MWRRDTGGENEAQPVDCATGFVSSRSRALFRNAQFRGRPAVSTIEQERMLPDPALESLLNRRLLAIDDVSGNNQRHGRQLTGETLT